MMNDFLKYIYCILGDIPNFTNIVGLCVFFFRNIKSISDEIMLLFLLILLCLVFYISLKFVWPIALIFIN